jgi:hypothetical protein
MLMCGQYSLKHFRAQGLFLIFYSQPHRACLASLDSPTSAEPSADDDRWCFLARLRVGRAQGFGVIRNGLL